MPYRRKGKDARRGLYTLVTLPKFGKIRRWTGINDIRVARAMEAWLLEPSRNRGGPRTWKGRSAKPLDRESTEHSRPRSHCRTP